VGATVGHGNSDVDMADRKRSATWDSGALGDDRVFRCADLANTGRECVGLVGRGATIGCGASATRTGQGGRLNNSVAVTGIGSFSVVAVNREPSTVLFGSPRGYCGTVHSGRGRFVWEIRAPVRFRSFAWT